MIPSTFRRGLLLFASCLLIPAPGLPAQTNSAPAPATAAAPAPPIVLDKAYTAIVSMSSRSGGAMRQRIYVSDGKIRTDQLDGMPMTMILRPDQQKIYSIVQQQKMVMVMPFNPQKMQAEMALASGQGGTYDKIGSSTVSGIACDEYKFTANDGKIFNIWVDPRKKVPVQVEPEDHSSLITIKDYLPGPQLPMLFEVPPNYTVMNMGGRPPGQ